MIPRIFRLTCSAMALVTVGLARGQETEPEVQRIVILHTNDLHGHLTPWKGWEGELQGKTIGGLGRLGAAIADARRAHPEAVLLLDAGDLIGDTMIAARTDGRALIEALNYLKYDAVTLGNHEPDFAMETLRRRAEEANFPFLAANLTARSADFFKPYVIKKVNGVTVAILGLTYPKTNRTTAPKNVSAVAFGDPVSAAKQYVPKLRHDGADVIVVSSHLGLSADKELAQSVEGIDVIVGGHSHNRMAEAEQVGQCLIVHAGAHGSDLGRLDLIIEKKAGKATITGHHRTLRLLDHATVPSEPQAEEFLERLVRPHREALAEVVGEASDWLVRAQTLAGQHARRRDAESPIDSLFADILRAETKADIGLLPGVGYGVAIPPGPVSKADLRQMIPHDGEVVTMRLRGDQVLEILEQAVENVFSDDPDVKVGGMLQVSGIRFRYDPKLVKGERIVHVETTDGGWDRSARYRVATNTMLAAGGHNYGTFKSGEERTEHGSQFEMICRWFIPRCLRLWKVASDGLSIQRITRRNKP